MEMGLSEGRKGQGRGKGGKGARGGRKGRAGGRKGEGGRGETGGKGWKVENGGGGKFDQGYYRWKLAGTDKRAGNLKHNKTSSQPASKSSSSPDRQEGNEAAVRPESPPGRDRTRDMGTYNDPSPALPLSYWWLAIFVEKYTSKDTTQQAVICKSAVIISNNRRMCI